ncbi:MobF family relaxase [Alloscardovia venturai]|uniref:MobF family relaxase n=1 Tax=Alloscardovia venturai TaxID=1769421 RepID=A0ABW2Y8N2_9BIFI
MGMSLKLIRHGYSSYFEDSISDAEFEFARAHPGMTAYYTHQSNPVGRYLGSALDIINRTSGDMIEREEFNAWFDNFRHPDSKKLLIKNMSIHTADPRKPNSKATLQGVDMTFTVPKSVSILYALADENTRHIIDKAHYEAVAQAVADAEKTAAKTRQGHAGAAVVDATGFAAGSYTHFTNREGEPHLHTHVTVTSIVRRKSDGKLTMLDARHLLGQKQAIQHAHDGYFEDNLYTMLGISLAETPSVSGKGYTREIKNFPPDLIRALSSRARQISDAQEYMVERFRQQHGREPNESEKQDIKDRAFYNTRKVKTNETRSLDYAAEVTQEVLDKLAISKSDITSIDTSNEQTIINIHALKDGELNNLLMDVIKHRLITDTETQLDPATATNTQLLQQAGNIANRNKTIITEGTIRAVANDLLRSVRFTIPEQRNHTANLLASQVKDELVQLDEMRYQIPDKLKNDPRIATRDLFGNLTSTLDAKQGGHKYVSRRLWQAEDNLLNIMSQEKEAICTTDTVQALLDEYDKTQKFPLSADQRAAVIQAATTTHVMFGIIGPAGTGKTTTLRALKYVIDHEQGSGHVIGTAQSANAAQEVATSLDISTANISQIITELDTHAYARKKDRILNALQSSDVSKPQAEALERELIEVQARIDQTTIKENSTLIVDEAGMTDTLSFDRLMSEAIAKNCRVIAVGDHYQLASVGTGDGTLFELVSQGMFAELKEAFRFVDKTYNQVADHLRVMKKDANGSYVAVKELRKRDSIHQGTRENMMSQITVRAIQDKKEGKTTLIIAPDNDSVAELNKQISQQLHAAGLLDARGDTRSRFTFADGNQYGVGDTICTRENDNAIRASNNQRVQNGDLWTITAISQETKTIHAVSVNDPTITVNIPFEYAATSVGGGYALTVHRSQGKTVDTSYMYVTEDSVINNSFLYVGMTRGRQSNEVYLGFNDNLSPGEKLEWSRAKQKDHIAQGKHLWSGYGKNPDPDKYYTENDLLPTDVERADAFLQHAITGKLGRFAHTMKKQYHQSAHAINTLVSDYQYVQNIIVAHDVHEILSRKHDGHYVEQIMSDPSINQLLDAYQKAYALDPKIANQILTDRIHGSADINTSISDILFDTVNPTDPVNVITRKLNEFNAAYRGTSVLGDTGHLTDYTPQYPSDDTDAWLNMLGQARTMLNSALDQEIQRAVTRPRAWQKNILGKRPVPQAGSKEYDAYVDIIRRILIYRAGNDITHPFSPLGEKVKARVNPGRAAWKHNLESMIYNFKNPNNTPRFVPTEYSIIPQTGATPEPPAEHMVDAETYNRIIRLNETMMTTWRKSDNTYRDKYAKEYGLRSSLIAYIPPVNEATLKIWSHNTGYSLDDFAQAGLAVKNEDGSWKPTFTHAIVTPVRNSNGDIVAFTGMNPATCEEILPRTTDVFTRDQQFYGVNKKIAKELKQKDPTILLASSPLEVQQATKGLRFGQHMPALAPADGNYSSEHAHQLTKLTGEQSKNIILVATGDKNKDKEFFRNVFTSLTPQEKAAARVVNQQNASERKTVTEIVQDATPLWQAIVDVAMSDNLTQSTAVDVQHEINQNVIDKLPLSTRQEADTYTRQAITQQLAQQQAAQQQQEVENMMRIQQQQAQNQINTAE